MIPKIEKVRKETAKVMMKDQDVIELVDSISLGIIKACKTPATSVTIGTHVMGERLTFVAGELTRAGYDVDILPGSLISIGW